jgi:hypothetical protein
MLKELNQLLQEKGETNRYQLLVWATDELMYRQIDHEIIRIDEKRILSFRLFNETEEYYGFKRQGKVQVRHLVDISTERKYIEKTVKLKGNIAQFIQPDAENNLMLVSRDYLSYKPNGQAYYSDSRMVTIAPLKLIENE